MAFRPHPFTLRQLQYAVAVAEELSFRRAAERCRVAQPSLSAQLAQLEDALGTRLFERGRRRVLVTPAGRDLVERARRLLVDADALLDAGNRARDPFTGILRVGVIPTVAPYYLPSAVPVLRAAFPRLTFAWREDKTQVLVSLLDSGELDAAVLALEADVGDVDHAVIGTDRFVLAASPEHPLGRDQAPVQNSELRACEVLLLEEGHCFRTQALDVCGAARAREGEFRATSLGTLVQMVAGGAGITLLPELAVAAEAARADLRVRPLASARAQRTIALVWRRQSPLAVALRELATVLEKAFPAREKARPRSRAKR